MSRVLAFLVGLSTLVTSGCGGDPPATGDSGSAQPEAAATQSASPPAVDYATAVSTGNVEAVKQHLAAGADPNAKNADGGPILNGAAVFGHREIVALLIEKGAEIGVKDGNGNGPLHSAAFLGRSDVVELLLEKGADVNVKNNNGETPMDTLGADWGTTQFIGNLLKIPLDRPSIEAGRAKTRELLAKRGGKNGGGAGGGLHAAVRRQDLAAVKAALDDKGNPNAPDQQVGMTPLAWAAAVGNVEISKLLIERGANVNGKNADGATPLHVASFLGRAGVVELLLAKKGDPNARNTKGETPLFSAQVPASLVPVIAGLLQMEVDQKAVEQGRPKVIELLEQGGAKTTGTGGVKLIAAIRKQDVAAVKQALADKGDPNGQDPESGTTALGWAALVGNVEIARMLLAAGADANGKTRDGSGPLSAAAFLGRADVCELLLNSGSDPKLKNNEGEDPLSATAVEAGATQFVAGLLKVQIDIGKVQAGRAKCAELLKNGTGSKELSAAVRKQDVAAVKTLLAKPTGNPNVQDPDLGITVLSWAAFHGNAEIATLLIAAKADVNGKNRDGSSALHAAAFTGSVAVLELLLAKGADARAKSKDGQTPLQSTEADAATTKVAAGFLQLKLDQKTVDAGRVKCVELLKKKTAKP